MSATTLPQGQARRDFYRTPSWVTQALVPHVWPKHLAPPKRILDAGAGDGAITRELVAGFPDAFVSGVEIDAFHLKAEGCDSHVLCEDFFESAIRTDWDLIVSNPPFSQAMAFLERSLALVEEPRGAVAMLLRLGFMAGQERAAFHRVVPSDVFVLSKRPSFTGKGADATDYAWFVFAPWSSGRWRTIP